jgi:hypothetical protein
MIDSNSMREGPRMFCRTAAIFLLFAVPSVANCCSICDPNFLQKPTLRQSALTARFVVLGTLNNARLDGERGMTDLIVDQVIRDDAVIARQKTITVPGYIPFDAKNPPKYLVFGDVLNGKIDVVRGSPVKNAEVAEYLRKSLKIEDRERNKMLQFFFQHVDSANPDIAADAFHEFAKASDQEIFSVAKSLAPAKVRKLLKDPGTPPERVGIFAFLLGACGTKEDAEFLAALIRKKDERGNNALSGLLGGLIELRPDEGWALTAQILADGKRPYADRLAALGTLRFFHASKPKESRSEIVKGMAAVIQDGDMADMGLEDLRRWQWWELTPLVIKQYGKPSHSSPIVRRAIVRYALCCPNVEAAVFVKERRKAEPELVRQVEESIEFEKPSPALPKSQP